MLYIDIINQLRSDIAAQASRILSSRNGGNATVEAASVIAFRHPNSGRWHARVVGVTGVESDSSHGYDSETEALCSLADEAKAAAEREGAWVEHHLIDRLRTQEGALTMYRERTAALTRGVLETLGALDNIGEASSLAREQQLLLERK